MIRAAIQILANSVGLLVAAHLLPGIHYEGSFAYLLLAGLVIGLINLLVRPIVAFFSFPLIVLTLGLFYLVVNALMLYLAAALLSGLSIDGCGQAILGALIMGLVNWAVRLVAGEEPADRRRAR